MASVKAAGQTIKRLWKEGWVMIPEVMASHILSTIGLIGMGYIYYEYKNKNILARNFVKPQFFRPDDPRAKKTVTYYEEGWDKK